MAMTTSWAFPNIFDVSRNKVGILQDTASIVNRTRLLMLTEPTEVYDNPDQGVGLRKHIWKYNNQNEISIIQERIRTQLERHEPCVDPERTAFADGLLFTGSDSEQISHESSTLKLTVGLHTIFGDSVEVDINK